MRLRSWDPCPRICHWQEHCEEDRSSQPLEVTPVKHERKVLSQGWFSSAPRQVGHHGESYPVSGRMSLLEVVSRDSNKVQSPVDLVQSAQSTWQKFVQSTWSSYTNSLASMSVTGGEQTVLQVTTGFQQDEDDFFCFLTDLHLGCGKTGQGCRQIQKAQVR